MTKLESQAIIPARDGFYLVRFDEGYEQLYYEPIIAWDIAVRSSASDDRRARVFPITTEGLADPDSDDWLIKRPDGIMSGPFTGDMDAGRALEYFKQLAADRAAKYAGGSR